MSKHRQQDGNSSSLGDPKTAREQDRKRQAQPNPRRSGTDGNDTPSPKSGQDTGETNSRKGAKGELAGDRDYGHGDRQTKRNDNLSSG